ncbi:MAG: DUF4013 domain-containing protein [Coriobacteriales bacterium]|nr:DUF4013 domain-containing protein [Coriobacteriales bacterium]
MNDSKYFSRSWALLTRDKGWIKPILVMTVASLVPIAGFLGNSGYILEWARLTAWGVDSAPKQRNVNIGACIHSGWRAFVVALGWGLCLSIAVSLVNAIISVLPDTLAAILGMLFGLVTMVVYAVYGVVMNIAQIRTSIYESIAAGYRIDRVFEMIKRDTKGFCLLFLMGLCCSMVLGIAVFFMIMVIMSLLVPFVMMASSASGSEAMLGIVTAILIPLMVLSVLFSALFSFLFIGTEMLLKTATALWMRQFDVPSWGKSADPLPDQPIAEESHQPAGFTVVQPYTSAPVTEQPVEQEPPAQPEPEPEPTPALELEPTPELVPESNQEPEPDLESETKEPEESGPNADDAEEASTDTRVKNVDDLYADLYDVIQRSNRTGDDQ